MDQCVGVDPSIAAYRGLDQIRTLEEAYPYLVQSPDEEGGKI
jgi:hypothetical protein